jgi:ribulose-phosphate 3-epimerase
MQSAHLGTNPILEVDGGIGPTTITAAARSGAQWLVAGNAVFRTPDPVAAWRSLTAAAAGGAGERG